jgi:hypothetical protein
LRAETIVANNAAEVNQVTEPETTDRIVGQGRALVRAIEALETIESTGPIERVMTWFLLQLALYTSSEVHSGEVQEATKRPVAGVPFELYRGC